MAYRTRSGTRRVSWWAHHAELDVLRSDAKKFGTSVSNRVRAWWQSGLPLLVDADLLDEHPEDWASLAHHLPRWAPHKPGTPRSKYEPWPLPAGVLMVDDDA